MNYSLDIRTGAFTLAGSLVRRYVGSTLVDQPVMGEAPASKWLPSGALTDSMKLGDAPSPQAIYSAAVTDGAIHADLMQFGIPVNVVDQVNIADALAVLRGLVVLDGLQITESLDPQARYGVALTQAIASSDALQAFFGASLTDGVVLHDNLAQNFFVTAQLTENFALFDALAGSLLMSVTLQDGIEIDDFDVLKMIFNGELTDDMHVVASYVGPDGGITTWAINSRTGAVTEYRNWQFSSFAQLGKSYVGAGPGGDGLYLLEGSRDDGANIVARMRGGVLELNGSRFVSFKAIYLGMRSEDDAPEYFLKLVDPAGRTYIYSTRPRDMRTTKIDVGKGLRSRYWQWELVSMAADFTLDTIEFVPLMPQRRV